MRNKPIHTESPGWCQCHHCKSLKSGLFNKWGWHNLKSMLKNIPWLLSHLKHKNEIQSGSQRKSWKKLLEGNIGEYLRGTEIDKDFSNRKKKY